MVVVFVLDAWKLGLHYSVITAFALEKLMYVFLCQCLISLSLSLHLLSMLEYDTENMNSDEIFSSLRGVTEAIQSFSYRSQEDLNEPIRRDGKKDDAVSVCFKTGQQHHQILLFKMTCTD